MGDVVGIVDLRKEGTRSADAHRVRTCQRLASAQAPSLVNYRKVRHQNFLNICENSEGDVAIDGNGFGASLCAAF